MVIKELYVFLKKSKYLTLSIFFFFSITSFAQDMKPYGLSMQGHIVHSSINDREYQLYISLPSNYNEKADTFYPVLYLLDAYYSYPIISSLHKLLESSQEIKDVIIVAIGDKDQSTLAWFKNRMIDYTPSNDPNVDEEIANSLNINISEVKTGGASYFLKCLRQDIIPFIDKNYKTTGDRGIAGHSVAGLFSAYCLVHAPDLFSNFGINSASLFWNNNEMLVDLKGFNMENRTLKANVFISYGSLEPKIIISSIHSFVDTMNNNKPENIVLSLKVFEEETHTTVIGASLSKTINALYSR